MSATYQVCITAGGTNDRRRGWWWPPINFHVSTAVIETCRGVTRGTKLFRPSRGGFSWASLWRDALYGAPFVILEPEGAQVTGRGMDFFDELGLEIHSLPKGRRPSCRALAWSSERAALSRGWPSRCASSRILFLEHRWLERQAPPGAANAPNTGRGNWRR